MLTQNPITRHDPQKLVRLIAIRPLFANGQRIEAGQEFEVQARHAGEILATLRADFASQSDRWQVYKTVEQF